MRAFHAEVSGSAVGTYEMDISGVCLGTYALVFTGTATASLEVYLGGNVWVEFIAAGSSNTLITSACAGHKARINISAYTSGTVTLYANGMRG